MSLDDGKGALPYDIRGQAVQALAPKWNVATASLANGGAVSFDLTTYPGAKLFRFKTANEELLDVSFGALTGSWPSSGDTFAFARGCEKITLTNNTLAAVTYYALVG